MKAYTDGERIYKVGSLGANCWRNIEIYKVGGDENCCWIVTSSHEIYKELGDTSWISDIEAEKALAKCAKALGWKEI